MSRVLLLRLNDRFGGALDRTVAIFDGTYERPFFHQLVSSQLDMDRLDYLRRDSFYTGVAEGEVGVQRIIKTMRVNPLDGGPDAEITVESKGIYAVENFLISRRLMYWQVYLHKTVLAGDQLLRAVLRRVRAHFAAGTAPDGIEKGSDALCFFLKRRLTGDDIETPEVRRQYCRIDDTDILFSLKQWMHVDDPILADLCRRFVNRELFRVTFLSETPTDDQMAAWRAQVADWLVTEGLTTTDRAEADAERYLTLDFSRHSAYKRSHDSIGILGRDGTVRELSESADTATVAELTNFVEKPYLCYPKAVDLTLDPVLSG
jgi:hypothetical protein